MSATEQYYAQCVCDGVCPVSDETVEYLNGLGLDWITYIDHEYTSPRTGMSWTDRCITLRTVARLLHADLENREILDFASDIVSTYLGDDASEW